MNPRLFRLPLWTALLATGAACHRQEVVVYNAPKDAAPPAGEAAAAPHAHGEGSPLDSTAPTPSNRPPLPRLSWKLPPGWSETGPGQMSVASFSIKTDGGMASVSVTPLPNLAGQETMIVNMWRQQAGAPELSPQEAEAALSPVEAAGKAGKLFEITSSREGKTSRIVTAMLNRSEGTWFFKLAGDDAAVATQKPVFLEFLKTFEFEDKGLTVPADASNLPVAAAPPAPATSAPAPAKADEATSFPLPEGWSTLPAGQMQVAKFAVPAQGEAKAEVAVSMFANDTGGTNANVGRWRRQLGMPDLPEAELSALTQPLDATLPGALVADLQHEKRRMIGVIVPRSGNWWFYKLMGDADAVAAARPTFLEFAKVAPKS